MKAMNILAVLILISTSLFAQNDNPNYDEELAIELAADDYGMKSYVLVILKSGTNKTQDAAVLDSCFTGHMSNIHRLVDSGQLIVAGPLGNNDKEYRGIFIFDVETVEEASELLKSDLAIQAEILAAELYPWYGSAALPTYLKDSDRIWKLKP